MIAFAVFFIFSLLFYLVLTAGSGNIVFWAPEELFFGVLFAAITALLAKRLFQAMGIKPTARMLSPKRWLIFLVYAAGPFFYAMILANIDVACRVITGKIKPGIVKISPGMKTDFSTTMLANSITLTPGTLSVDVDKKGNLYIHWIFVKDKQPSVADICGSFPKWVRRIAE
ncbi:MAG: Na+/H+ antiporter subunit E [Candidatus Diapherotrites archaeon]|nr:Na+/H+ antiporter subunit E [Candidatus Diapherotrites archaeon]